MPISPEDNNDHGVDGREVLDENEENLEGADGAEGDEDMPEAGPRADESAQEADARRTRIAERLGTEAEWQGIVEPPPEAPEGASRPPRGERIRPVPKPVAPTRRERELHELCHYPYASWCKHCVKGKAISDPHRKLKKHAW